ncbi:MobF family relaxase [Paraburkholderia sp. C35]|uniref:MobF family relaxase n=1 Tax=Paraburkholderia sp. C35 TaxID=2126993 RepID=UPI000D689F8D|nr:MobF family relaxase [Paraburkholderia sp. C35]
MESISSVKITAESAEAYHVNGREHSALSTAELEAYYNQKGDGQEWLDAVWHGGAAESFFDLHGRVSRDDFGAMLRGIHPRTGEMLIEEHAATRDRRAALDLTFSAPKSVSILWAMDNRDSGTLWKAIEQAQLSGVRFALDVYERNGAHVRLGAGGQFKVPAQIATAIFQHGSSRISQANLAAGLPPDVNIHSHALVMNLGVFNPADRPLGEPWMMKEDGLAGLTPEMVSSAESAYQAWAEKHPQYALRYDLASYVSYAQMKWASEAAKRATATVDGNGRPNVRAMEYADAFHWKMATGAAYRVAMAWELRKAGLEIERDGLSYTIGGVPKALIEELSTRREEILTLLNEKNVSGGKAAEMANLDTRLSKAEARFEEIQQRVIDLARGHGFELGQVGVGQREMLSFEQSWAEFRRAELKADFDIVVKRIHDTVHLPERARELIGKQEFQYAQRLRQIERDAEAGRGRAQLTSRVMEQVTEQRAVFKSQDIYREIFIATTGLADPETALSIAKDAVDMCIPLHRMLEIHEKGITKHVRVDRLTTPAMLRLEQKNEQRILAMVKNSRHEPIQREIANAALAQFYADKRANQAPGDKPFQLKLEQLRTVSEVSRNTFAVVIGRAGTGKSTTMGAVAAIHTAAGYQVYGVSPLSKAGKELGTDAGITSASVDKFLAEVREGRITLNSKTLVIVDEAGRLASRQMDKLLNVIDRSGAKMTVVGDHKQTQPFGAGAPFRAAMESLQTIGRKVPELKQISRQRDLEHRAAVDQVRNLSAAEAIKWHLKRGEVLIVKNEKDVPLAMAREALRRQDALALQGKRDPFFMLTKENKQADLVNAAMRTELKARGALVDGKDFTDKRGQKIEIATGDRLMITKNDNRKGGSKLANGDTLSVKEIRGAEIVVHVDRTGQEQVLRTDEQELRYGYAMTIDKSQGISPEQTLAWGTRNFSAEHAYVAESRARAAGGWVFSEKELNAIGALAPVPQLWRDIAKDLEQARIAGGAAPILDAEALKDFNAVYAYLEKHAPLALDSPDAPYERGSQLNKIAHALTAMQTSQQKENVGDYTMTGKALQAGGRYGNEMTGVSGAADTVSPEIVLSQLETVIEQIDMYLTNVQENLSGSEIYEESMTALRDVAPNSVNEADLKEWAEAVQEAAAVAREVIATPELADLNEAAVDQLTRVFGGTAHTDIADAEGLGEPGRALWEHDAAAEVQATIGDMAPDHDSLDAGNDLAESFGRGYDDQLDERSSRDTAIAGLED